MADVVPSLSFFNGQTPHQEGVGLVFFRALYVWQGLLTFGTPGELHTHLVASNTGQPAAHRLPLATRCKLVYQRSLGYDT